LPVLTTFSIIMTKYPHKKIYPPVKYTASNFEYYDTLPPDFRLAKLEDFTENGKRKIGMVFLIQWVHYEDVFQICNVSMNLTSDFLKPFIEADRVYVGPN